MGMACAAHHNSRSFGAFISVAYSKQPTTEAVHPELAKITLSARAELVLAQSARINEVEGARVCRHLSQISLGILGAAPTVSADIHRSRFRRTLPPNSSPS